MKKPTTSDSNFTNRICGCLNCITPPHMLRKLLESRDKDIRQAALNTLVATSRLRGERAIRGLVAGAAGAGSGRRTVFDCRHSTDLTTAVLARPEDGAASADQAVNRAFDGLGATRDFFLKVFDRNSIDGNGMRLNAYVHRGENYNNAFWDGQQMVFGDGDNRVFTDFTKSVDVIAHELTHGVTEFIAGLRYHNQSGALNESMSDVFGSLVKQWLLKQSAAEADWLLGSEIFTPDIDADALRSLKAPGTAYDNELLGRDPQPGHMDQYQRLPDTDDGDNGGVHINSGIPNRAFYLTAVAIGGFAWEAAGPVWYGALRSSGPNTEFQEFADLTYAEAGKLFTQGSPEQQAVSDSWRQVGVKISGAVAGNARPRRRVNGGAEAPDDQFAVLLKQVELLTVQVKGLSKDVAALRK